MDRHREDRFSAGQFGCAVVGGEHHRHVLGFTGAHPDDAGRKTGDEARFVDLGLLALGRPALECDAVDPSFVVERDRIAELDGPIDRYQDGSLFAHRLQGPLELIIGRRLRLSIELDPGVIFYFNGRADRNDRPETSGAPSSSGISST